MTISPSRLTYVSKCSFFKPTPFKSTAASEGIDLHYQMEELVKVHWSEWTEYIDKLRLSEDSKGLILTAAERLLPLVSMLPDYQCHAGQMLTKNTESLATGVYPELQIETARGKFGYIDLLINFGNKIVIVDYKFVRSPGDYELQLAAYALCVSHNLVNPPATIESHIIAPYLHDEDQGVCSWVYTPDIIQQYEAIIQRIEDSVGDPNKTATPGGHCQYCAWCGKCSKQANTIADATLPPSVRYTPDIMKATTLEDRALRRDLVKFIEAVATSIKEDDKQFFADNPDATLPGYKTVRCAGRASFDKTRTSELNREILSRFPNLTPSLLLDVSLPDQKQLIEVLSVTEGLGTSRATAEVSDIFSMFTTRGAPYVTLKRATQEMRVPGAVNVLPDPMELLM